MQMRKKIQILTATNRHCRRRLDQKINLEDVLSFLRENYSEQSFAFLKTQLQILNKAPRGSRYTEEFKQFALSIYFLGPKAYKKISSICRLPSKTTLCRFTKRSVIRPGFND